MRKNSKTKLTGEKVVLIPYKKNHVLKYHHWMQCTELLELTASDPLTLDEEYKMQQSWLQDDDKCTFIVLDKGIFEHSGNEVDAMIGDVNLYLNDPDDLNVAEIEVMIADPIHRSKGRGREALLLMLRYGIEILSIHKFVAKIKMKNEASLKLFEKIGFLETGRSQVFEEIEMSCDIKKEWLEGLKNQTKLFRIEELLSDENSIS